MSHFRMVRPAKAIPALDGLRAIAIILVVMRHGIRPFWSESDGFVAVAGWDLGTPFINGWVGVDLFFVLSGFLITHHIVQRYGADFARSDVKDYVVRRAYRIVPAYVATLIIVLIGLVPKYSVSGDGLGWRTLYHLGFLQDYLPSDIVVVFWSLGVEEKFYVLLPFLLMGVLRMPRASMRYTSVAGLIVLPLVFRILTAAGNADVTDYESFFATFRSPAHLTYDGLAVGVLCGLIYTDRRRWAWTSTVRVPNRLFWIGAAGFAGMLFGQPLLDHVNWFDKTLLQAFLAWSAGAMLLGLVMHGGPQSALSGRRLFIISRLSYSWYLVHVLVIPLVLHFTRGSLILFAPIYVGLSLLLAAGLHYGVEVPFLALRDRRVRRPTTDSTPAAALTSQA